MDVRAIRSIGWLQCADGSINLTPCFVTNTHPRLVNISRAEFDSLSGNKERMKQKAIDVLNDNADRDPLLENELAATIDSYKVIGICNAHLCEGDKSMLDMMASDDECNMVMKRDTGWFVKLYDAPEFNEREDMSSNLKKLLRGCLGAGFRMIEFDADAAYYSHLETFL